MNIKDIEAKIAELNQQLRDANAVATTEREALRKATKRQWKFTFIKAHKSHMAFERNRDAALEMWYLSGETVNKDACIAAGHSEDHLRTGGMGYWFNRCSGRIAFSSGGGNIYISQDTHGDEVVRGEQKLDSDNVFRALENFIIDNPNGGDVTDIILSQRHFGWKDR